MWHLQRCLSFAMVLSLPLFTEALSVWNDISGERLQLGEWLGEGWRRGSLGSTERVRCSLDWSSGPISVRDGRSHWVHVSIYQVIPKGCVLTGSG